MSLQYNRIFGNTPKQIINELEYIHEHNILKFSVLSPDNYQILVDNSYRNGSMIRVAGKLGISGLLECFISSKVFGEGPKILDLGGKRSEYDRMNLEAMENIEIGIELNDYNQPYPTMIVELPEEYTQKKVAYDPEFNVMHEPILVIINHDPKIKVIVCSVYFYNPKQPICEAITFCLLHKEECSIEELLKQAEEKLAYIGSLSTSQSELKSAYSVGRAAINALGILYETGCRKIGPSNPEYALKLMERIRKQERKFDADSRKKLKHNQEELRRMPVLYGFEQEIKLYDETIELKSTDINKNTGIELRPHWRRGYRRRQHYGPQNSQIKVVTIKPVLVNKYLYAGKNSDTKVTYGT